MPNPFVDDEAHVEDDEVLEDEVEDLESDEGDAGFEESREWDDEDGDGPLAQEQAEAEAEDAFDTWLESMTGKPKEPADSRTIDPDWHHKYDNKLSSLALHSGLHSEPTLSHYYRVKCKRGCEVAVVFAIMQAFARSSSDSDPSSTPTPSPAVTPPLILPLNPSLSFDDEDPSHADMHFAAEGRYIEQSASLTEQIRGLLDLIPSSSSVDNQLSQFAVDPVASLEEDVEPSKYVNDTLHNVFGWAARDEDYTKLVKDNLLGVAALCTWTKRCMEGFKLGSGIFDARLERVKMVLLNIASTSTVPPSTIPLPSQTPSVPIASAAKPAGNTSSSPLPAEILSAFSIPEVTGWVYIEGKLGRRLHSFLRRNPFVLRNRTGPIMETIWRRDISELLSMTPRSIELHTWVRVTRGLYRGDPALVVRREIAVGMRRLRLLVVPRWKRNSRDVQQELHGLADVEDDASGHALNKGQLAKQEAITRLRGARPFQRLAKKDAEGPYQHGLRVLVLSYSSVSLTNVTVNDFTRQCFLQSRHPICSQHSLPAPSTWVFFAGDRVRTIYQAPSPQPSTSVRISREILEREYLIDSVIVDVDPSTQRCQIQRADDATQALLLHDEGSWVPFVNLRKAIRVGDSIEVVSGELMGNTGLVVSSSVHTLQAVSNLGSFHEFVVHKNHCRIVHERDESNIPWLRRHIRIVRGPYVGLTGFVIDVHPPRPLYTELEVFIPGNKVAVKVLHDHVLDTIGSHPLKDAVPLTPTQRHFEQVSWKTYPAPNLPEAPIDTNTNQPVTQRDVLRHTPPPPWIGLEVVEVGYTSPINRISGVPQNSRSSFKGATHIVRGVERVTTPPHGTSGLRLQLEPQVWTQAQGFGGLRWVEYERVRVKRIDGLMDSYLGLHEACPLRGPQKCYEPLIKLETKTVHRMIHLPRLKLAFQRSITPPWPENTPVDRSVPAWDPSSKTPERAPDHFNPFAEPSSTARSSSLSGPPAPEDQWILHPALHGRRVRALYRYPDGVDKVIWAIPDCQARTIKIEDKFYAPRTINAGELRRREKAINPTRFAGGLFAFRGAHSGSYLRRVYFKHRRDGEEPVMVCIVVKNWGTAAEMMGARVEVESADCVEVEDRLKGKWAATITQLRHEEQKGYRRPLKRQRI